MIDAVVFDLDGTLWDTCASCARAWNDVLRRHGIAFRPITEDDIRRVTGRPHEQCVRDVFTGLPEAQIVTLIVETQREDNLRVSGGGGVLYPGVAAGLRRLRAQYPLFIVSNCQQGYIEAFLAWSKLGEAFVDFECWGNTGRSKADNLGALIARHHLRSPVLVGDTPDDRQAARAWGATFAWVDYGFGVCTDYDRRCSSFAELTDWLLAVDTEPSRRNSA